MARLANAPAFVGDLVKEFLDSPAVARMLAYAADAGPNQVSLACHDLRKGKPAVVDSALLLPEIAVDYFDGQAFASMRPPPPVRTHSRGLGLTTESHTSFSRDSMCVAIAFVALSLCSWSSLSGRPCIENPTH